LGRTISIPAHSGSQLPRFDANRPHASPHPPSKAACERGSSVARCSCRERFFRRVQDAGRLRYAGSLMLPLSLPKELAERNVVGCVNGFRQALGELLVSRSPSRLFGSNVDNQLPVMAARRHKVTTVRPSSQPEILLPVNLIQRVQEFISTGGDHGDQYALLRECIRDGGATALAATQMMAEDMYGGITYNFNIKAPAALALVVFGVPGLRALVESAVRTPTSKNVSLCLGVLASVAAGLPPRRLEPFVRNMEIVETIRVASQQPGMADSARSLLREYVLGIEDEMDAVSAIGSQLSLAGWPGDAPEIIGELFAALAARRIATGPATIRAFEQLMHDRPMDEPTFHTYFEEHPQLLEPTAAEVWSKPDLAGVREPDFVIRRTDDTYLIIEIETPAKPLITGANQLSAPATQAVAQATTYRSFLVERFQLAATHFPRFSEPDCLVVIGNESQLHADQLAALARENRSRAGLCIVGYDWIARRALAIAQNVVEPRLTTQSIRVF
jgi:hypothetical protein